MRANQSERLRRSKESEVNHNRLRAHQIETMIAEFDRMCVDLGQQIEAEEKRTRISDPTHFAYSTYAKAVRERRARVQQSVGALRIELERLRLETNKSPEQQFAA
jgi:phage-related minor tail protein